MRLNALDDVIQGDQALNSLVEVAAVLEVLNVLHDVVDLALSGRVKRLLLWAFHLLNLLAKVLVVIHEVHLVVAGRVEI